MQKKPEIRFWQVVPPLWATLAPAQSYSKGGNRLLFFCMFRVAFKRFCWLCNASSNSPCWWLEGVGTSWRSSRLSSNGSPTFVWHRKCIKTMWKFNFKFFVPGLDVRNLHCVAYGLDVAGGCPGLRAEQSGDAGAEEVAHFDRKREKEDMNYAYWRGIRLRREGRYLNFWRKFLPSFPCIKHRRPPSPIERPRPRIKRKGSFPDIEKSWEKKKMFPVYPYHISQFGIWFFCVIHIYGKSRYAKIAFGWESRGRNGREDARRENDDDDYWFPASRMRKEFPAVRCTSLGHDLSDIQYIAKKAGETNWVLLEH